MGLQKYSNQLLVDVGFDVTVSSAPISTNDNVTLALSKVQAQLFELGVGTYVGTWNASTNTPTLSNATVETAGNWYNVVEAGTVDFGAGDIVFTTNDAVYSTGSVYAKRDLPNTEILLPEAQLLVGQPNGLAAPKAVGGQLSLDKNGVFTINFDARLTAGTFDGTLQGGGTQYFNSDITIDVADMVVGEEYVMYNSAAAIRSLTFTGTGAAVIGGDALLSGLVQSVNPGTFYSIKKQNATTVLIG